MRSSLNIKSYNPDVLSTIANLSNDEVFTSPDVTNKMLDLLPVEIWSDPHIKFLDPACKSGVFLREIAKRLIEGLEEKMPNLQDRLDHIFQKQIYGIAITELTSLLSRRSLYGSKYPNSIFSFSQFHNAEGNIQFEAIKHTWSGNNCIYCGASKSEFDRSEKLETHAYEFIHTVRPEEIFNMKFDVIVGNPPYQLSDGGAQASAIPIYHKFIEQAIKMDPRYITMIIPSRWFTGGKGLNSFRTQMLNDRKIKELHDFNDASDCFVGVEIKGGVNYFLWDRQYNGDCTIYTHENDEIVSVKKRSLKYGDEDIFIRHNEAIDILDKVMKFNEIKLSTKISSRKPFGLATNYSDFVEVKDAVNNIRVYANNKTGYISEKKIIKNKELVNKWKVLVPYAVGSGDMKRDQIKPFLAEPESCCTETYLVAMSTDNKKEAENLISYFNTKFFHFLVGIKKISQHTTSTVYSFVPEQDFSKIWDDKILYEKYMLTNTEIEYIEKTVRDLEE